MTAILITLAAGPFVIVGLAFAWSRVGAAVDHMRREEREQALDNDAEWAGCLIHWG